MLLNFSFLYTDFIAFSLFYQVSVLFNSLTTHPNDFVEVCSAFIQCWLQFFFTSLHFTGKAFAEEVKNTTDLFIMHSSLLEILPQLLILNIP